MRWYKIHHFHAKITLVLFRLLMGSISTYLVHKSPVPVTVIRPQKKKKAAHKRPVHAVPLSQSKVWFYHWFVHHEINPMFICRCSNRSVGCGWSQQGSYLHQHHRQKDIYFKQYICSNTINNHWQKVVYYIQYLLAIDFIYPIFVLLKRKPYYHHPLKYRNLHRTKQKLADHH